MLGPNASKQSLAPADDANKLPIIVTVYLQFLVTLNGTFSSYIAHS